MKALIRKYPINCSKQFQNEVFWQSAWPDWIDSDGKPLTNEEYKYALCQEAGEPLPYDPEHPERKITADDFVVTEHERIDEDGKTVKYWVAVRKTA